MEGSESENLREKHTLMNDMLKLTAEVLLHQVSLLQRRKIA
jgi:hypothetical protein